MNVDSALTIDIYLSVSHQANVEAFIEFLSDDVDSIRHVFNVGGSYHNMPFTEHMHDDTTNFMPLIIERVGCLFSSHGEVIWG